MKHGKAIGVEPEEACVYLGQFGAETGILENKRSHPSMVISSTAAHLRGPGKEVGDNNNLPPCQAPEEREGMPGMSTLCPRAWML